LSACWITSSLCLEAYDAYLRGLAYSLKPLSNTPANALAAQKSQRCFFPAQVTRIESGCEKTLPARQ
jgi:hypothetical protein